MANAQNRVALLTQNYMSTHFKTLVSGYMKPGETAEECTRREVLEEIGIELEDLRFVATYWFGRKDQLMIGFIGRAKKAPLKLSSEVDEARWVKVEEAIGMVHPKGSVSYALLEIYNQELAQ